MKYPKNFLDAIRSSESVFFVGSGISMWSGLPHWKGLLEQMVNYLVNRGLSNEHYSEILDVIDKGDLLTAASLCSLKMRDADLSDFIEELFMKTNPQPHDIHKLLINLGPNCFITTNYDELIEDAYYTYNKSKLSVVNNDQLIEQAKLQKSGASNFIFKIHGSINSAKTIVLSREDYRKLINQNRSTTDTLKFLFASRAIIYIGFGLRDPDFQLLKDEIRSTFLGAEREHFAIISDIGDLESEYWKREYGINIIPYETIERIENGKKVWSHENLYSTLENIFNETRVKSPSNENGSLKTSLVRYLDSICHILNMSNNEYTINLSAKQRYDLYAGRNKIERLIKFSMPINEVYNLNTNLVVFGSPGTGKTKSVQRYSYSTAKSCLDKILACNDVEELDLKHSIPVLLPMKEYKGDLRKMIESRLPSTIDVDVALEKGWFIFIFDAVNEAPRNLIDDESRILYNNLQWLTNLYSRNRFIVTSRSMNYIQFLDYPIFEVQPINDTQLEKILADNGNARYGDLSSKMKDILKNPLFISLYLQSEQGESKVSDIKTLLENYLHLTEKQVISRTDIASDLIHLLFVNIAYELVDKGIQSINTSDFLIKLKEYEITPESSEILMKNILKSGIMVTDFDGEISFFHQSITEFLAAFRLLEYFFEDPFILEEKIINLKWNETLILFVGLLDKEKAKSVLRKIANTDIMFAVIAYQSAAIREDEIGRQLFQILQGRIQSPSISKAEKSNLASALNYIGEFGEETELLEMQNSEVVELSISASMVLARRGVVESFNKSLEGLLTDESWRSGNSYNKALKILALPSTLGTMFDEAMRLNNDTSEFILSNIANVISAYDSEDLYIKVTELLNSGDKNSILFAIKVLSELKTKKAQDKMLGLLRTLPSEYKRKIIHGFRDDMHRPIKYNDLTQVLFDLLNEKFIGSVAADFLYDLEEVEITKQAYEKLESCKNEIELLNLCNIVSKIDPNKVFVIIEDKLNNYNSDLEDSLVHVLRHLNKNYPLTDYLINKITNCEAEVRSVILNIISFENYENEKYSISQESFVTLFALWEEYCQSGRDSWSDRKALSNLIGHNCYHSEKKFILQQLNDKDYKHRYFLTEMLIHCPINSKDIEGEVLFWLTNLVAGKLPDMKRYELEVLLSKTCNEASLMKYVVPLLKSEEDFIKSSAYNIIKRFERLVGKRYNIQYL
nr:SIR2 family protein [Paenibacillus xylanexedens]